MTLVGILKAIFKLSLLALFLILITTGALTWFVWEQPGQAVKIASIFLGFSIQDAEMDWDGKIRLKNLEKKPFGRVEEISAEWDWDEIREQKLKSLHIRGAEFSVPVPKKKNWLARVTDKSVLPTQIPEIPEILVEESTVEFPSGQRLYIPRAEVKQTTPGSAQMTTQDLDFGQTGSVGTVLAEWDWAQWPVFKRVEVNGLKLDFENVQALLSKPGAQPQDAAPAPAPAPASAGSAAPTPAQPPFRIASFQLTDAEIILPDNRQTAEIEKIVFQDDLEDQTVQLKMDFFRAGDFARIDRLKLEWNWPDLLARTVDYLDVTGATISLDRLTDAYPPTDEDEKQDPGLGFHLNELRIRQSQILKNVFGDRLPPLRIPISQASPDLVFRNLQLGGPKNDPAARKPVEAVIDDYVLYSPYDGISPMLSFGRIRVVFSWAGIQEHRLEQLQILSPTIYVGNDLFWFSEDVCQASNNREGSIQPWTIGNFSLENGKVELIAYGRSSVKLPFHFNIEPHTDLVVGDLTALHLKTNAVIPETTIEYPDYGNLRFVNLRGKMEFSLPLGADNIVNTLDIDHIEWKGLKSGEGQVWVTYDARGIYGGFYVKAYGGDLGGDLTFYWDRSLTWIGSCYTRSMDIEPVTELLSPENFVMSGPVESRFVVRGEAREIQGMGGEVEVNEGGDMHIVAVDELLQKIPEDWKPFKRELVVTALEAFRDYHYDDGNCEFAYSPPQSFLRLRLNGLQGKRNFHIRWLDKSHLADAIQMPAFGQEP